MAKVIDPVRMRAAVLAVGDWITGDGAAPPRADIAAAVRLTARAMAQDAPGASVEVRIPPFVAVQCIDGVRHTRGTPPNVVETDPLTWLRLVTGRIDLETAIAEAAIEVSGSRAGEIGRLLPLLRL
jgi:hypothetical protein